MRSNALRPVTLHPNVLLNPKAYPLTEDEMLLHSCKALAYFHDINLATNMALSIINKKMQSIAFKFIAIGHAYRENLNQAFNTIFKIASQCEMELALKEISMILTDKADFYNAIKIAEIIYYDDDDDLRDSVFVYICKNLTRRNAFRSATSCAEKIKNIDEKDTVLHFICKALVNIEDFDEAFRAAKNIANGSIKLSIFQYIESKKNITQKNLAY